MMKSYGFFVAVLVLLAGCVGESQAALITSSNQLTGTLQTADFSAFNQPLTPIGTSTISLGNGVTLTTDNANAVIGNDFYDLGSNGQRTPTGKPFAALNDLSGDLIFHFSQPVGQVGAFLNYAPGFGPDATITALNSKGMIVASYDLNKLAPISTPNGVNATAFRGIGIPATGITTLEVSNSAIVVDGLVFSTSPFTATPEPASMTLFGIGLCGLLGYRLRRKT